jgi:4-carboxymuconolactone decarboxylase
MNTRYESGLKLLNELHGGHTGENIIKAFGDISPNMLKWTVEFGFGEVMQNPALDLKTREMTIVASLIAQPAQPQLKAHLEAALNAGATKAELVAMIEQLALYVGFPTAVNAMILAKEVFLERT